MSTLTIDAMRKAMAVAMDGPSKLYISPAGWQALRANRQVSQSFVTEPHGIDRFSGLAVQELPELFPNEWFVVNAGGDVLSYSGDEKRINLLAKVAAGFRRRHA